MISDHWLIIYTALYLGVLFFIAYRSDQQPVGQFSPHQPLIYTLSITVYCTSWTFFGAVGSAAQSGWDFFSIYLGPIIVFVFFYPFLQKLVDVSKRHNTTSIADFIATRYGKSNRLAAVVTIIALIGILPYISLQIKAITSAYDLLSGTGSKTVTDAGFIDTALVLSLILAAFSMLFGARTIDASEHHRGMIHAVSFESAIKLLAFLAVAMFALNMITTATGGAAVPTTEMMLSHFNEKEITGSFFVKTVLAAAAIICLPRQFHVTAVEARGDELKAARWGFPLYLILFSAAVIPVTTAGLQMSPNPANADLFVLTLPMHQGQDWLTVVSYIGGFSAATGMVIVSTIALSTMASNDLIFPLLVRLRKADNKTNFYPALLLIRRSTIVVLMLLAYGYYLQAGSGKSLYSIGLLSFAAAAQFTPAMIGGLYWEKGHRNGAMIGLIIGFIIWFYTLLLPSLSGSAWLPDEFAVSGIFGLDWLKPYQLFGIPFEDPLTHGVFWSLLFNVAAYIVFSLRARHSFMDQLQARAYVNRDEDLTRDTRKHNWNVRVADLYELCKRIIGPVRAEQFFLECGYELGERMKEKADPHLVRQTEKVLAGTIGAATAEHLMRTAQAPEDYAYGDIYLWLDKTSQALQFNREILQVTIDNINQGVSVVDSDLRLVAWNRRYIELFDYPDNFIGVGKPIEEVIRYNVNRGMGIISKGSSGEEEIRKRLNYLKHGKPYTHVRYWPDGRVMQTQGARLPDGGFITTFTDISTLKQVERELEEINQNLERKVNERTEMLSRLNSELQQAKIMAEDATRSKTHFLAAASHDLTQPLGASKLYLGALLEDLADDEDKQSLASNALGALKTAESLLKSLLDISKLDSGSLKPKIKRFPIQQILTAIDTEFTVLAAEKGLKLRVVPTPLGTESDSTLLRSILQNFVSNAIRYTEAGSIMVVCRREGDKTRIEVRDSGVGIPEEKTNTIFEEFQQLDETSEGVGLGLSICHRTARLLGHEMRMKSAPGMGSCFSLLVPRRKADATENTSSEMQTFQKRWLTGISILCVDDDREILRATHTVLQRWGGTVKCLHSTRGFDSLANSDDHFDVVLMDYRLGSNANGLDLLKKYGETHHGNFLGVLITAEQDKEIEVNTLEHGFKYLAKPVEPAKLRAVLQAAFIDRKLTTATRPDQQQ